TVPGGVMVHGAITDTAGRGAWFRHAGLVSTDGKVSRPFTLGTDRRSYSVMVPAGRYQLVTDITDGEPGGESDDHYAFDVRSAPFTVAADTAVDFTLPADSDTEAISFVGPDGEPVEGDLSLRSTSPDNGVRLAAGIPGTASAAHGVFGSTTGDQVLVFAGGTVGAYFNGGFPLSLSGLPATPGGLIIVAEADGSDLALTEPVQDIVVDQTGPGSIAVRWTPPADDHGSAITGYAVRVIERSDVHEAWLTTPDPGAAISGLTPGTDNLVVVSVMTGRGVGAQNSLSFTLDGGPPAAGPDPDPDQAPAGQPAEPGHTTTASGGAGVSAGYWALGVDGRVYNFGEAPALGNATSGAVDLEPTPTGKGYWVLNRTGTVQAFGDAMELGDADMSKLAHGEQPASLSATPTGKGYWVFTNRGRVLAFGDAPFLGDMAQTRLNGPVLGSVATPSGHGYYLVASDGGIFSFGDAIFAGSMGGRKLNAPVTSLVPDRDGHGYWLVASDGGIFAFDAPFRGSMGGRKLNQPVVGMVRYGDGYLMVGADGGIFDFSTAPFSGSLGDQPPTAPVVAVAALP
ncbi:MAG TPA: fibronectin type III domain-containing protein, partial [Acidimicrobiia bacterium]|nr:fibronectin type III domain-containing protein [Acidimicrobiia bacterium]